MTHPSPPGPSSQPPNQPRPLRRPASHGRLSQLMVPGRSRSGSSASQASVNVDDMTGSSGRSTPELRRRASKAAAASLLANDAKYKKFRAQVDKSLQSFESVNEWADFISFLSRLLKTLQSPSPPYSEIPRKLIVAKRLAQCLNPALPSGVHQRALDVYAYIFSIIGVDGLQRDLIIWSSGLFPFFQYAATSVRPLLINIYETYYLPLGDDLRPATKAFILALLPGMEEETGDFFDKILFLLDRLSGAISPSFFLQNTFLILITSPASRLSALNYLARRMLKPADHPDATIETGLLIRGLAAVLDDENVLVRRNGLDLLLRVLKLDKNVVKEADPKDRELLVRSATGVVLQKELSLSRRVYTWLLGTDETSTEQVAYFKEHALDLLASTLLHDMQALGSGSEAVDVQRPFKIFLSLLDKWEVGTALSERLAIPALRTVMDAKSGADEVIDTASAVYEAIEPMVIWKVLHKSVEEQHGGDRSNVSHKESNLADRQAVDLVPWLLDNVPQPDEEVYSVHIPLMLDTVLSFAATDTINLETRGEALHLAVSLLRHIHSSTFTKASSSLSSSSHDTSAAEEAYSLAEITPRVESRLHSEVLPRIVQNAFSVCELALAENDLGALLDAVHVVSNLIDHEAPPLASIDGPRWLSSLVRTMSRVSSFVVVEALVVAALKASRCSVFKPAVVITSDATMSAILDSLFRYLRPSASLYHARAVELLWDYNQLAEIHTLENVIARRMSLSSFNSVALEAFGILWRLTDDSMLPGEILNVPINIVLDALRSPDPDAQRQAETWMRCNLRSYFRVLDPILSRLLDPSIKYAPGQTVYAAPVDLDLVRYEIESVSALFKFGGTGLSKACEATEIKGSLNFALVGRAEKQLEGVGTYLELMVRILVRFIETEAGPITSRGSGPLIVRVQSAALELLQTIVSRGDVSQPLLVTIKDCLVTKLLSAVETGRLTLQSKMLHLLHSAINASTPARNARPRPHQGHHRGASSIIEKPAPEPPASDFEHALVQAIIQGVSRPSNIAVLQHWIDFVLMTVPLLVGRPSLLNTLAECFSQETRALVQRISRAHDRATGVKGKGKARVVEDEKLDAADAEVVMALNALERVLMILGNQASGKIDEGVRQEEGGSRILGLVSTVFTVEAPSNDPKAESPRYLDDAVHALLVTWSATLPTGEDEDTRDWRGGPSTKQAYANIRGRARTVLEKVFKTQPGAVMSSCVHVWSLCSEQVTDAAIFDCVDTLTPSAQKVVELVCELASGKSSRQSVADYRADPSYLAFLEAYLSRLEAPIAVQVWITIFTFARDVVSAVASSSPRSQLFPLLQCLTDVALTVSKTSALEDRRLRKDLQDTYAKVLDLVVANASKIAEGGIWDRVEMSKDDGEDREKVGGVEDGLEKIYDYLATTIIPNLRALLVDPDRVNSACSGISVAIVVPAFKRQKVDASVLRIVLEITKIPSAVKTWRIQIADAFAEARLFKPKPASEINFYKTLICALMDSDKERFVDLLSRITSASSANINIFSNREQEMLVKSLNLRRLSLVLLAAERNHYLGQLPAIQERLVEMLRSGSVSPRVHSEVYLCLRVLMCRISPQHLTNFWPVILAELLRIFEQTMDELPEDNTEGLQLVLAACKFLDLLLVIQSEDFQVHQWMFVTDTTDAAYPPEEYTPDAIMDRLAEILAEKAMHTHGDSDLSQSQQSLPLLSPTAVSTGTGADVSLRRPRLGAAKSLTSLHQLQTFFARASMDTFESVFVNGGVDWDGVEDGLTDEIFDL
ncbi:hypothetical protein IAT38_000869 [Cryptococcus sp. DSM 104549]